MEDRTNKEGDDFHEYLLPNQRTSAENRNYTSTACGKPGFQKLQYDHHVGEWNAQPAKYDAPQAGAGIGLHHRRVVRAGPEQRMKKPPERAAGKGVRDGG